MNANFLHVKKCARNIPKEVLFKFDSRWLKPFPWTSTIEKWTCSSLPNMDRIEVFHEKNKFYPQQNCSALKRCQYLHLYCFVIAVWIFLKTVIKWIPLKLDQTSLEMPKQSSWHSFALFFLLTPKSLPPLTYGLQDLGREGQGDRGNLHVSLVNNFLFILFVTAIMFYLERNVVGKNCIQGNQAGLFHFTPAMFVFLSVVCEILM